jgi:hypothetical protein
MKKKIVFIIVSYKPDNQSLKVLKKSLEGVTLLVVDNTKNNRGYGGGANVGIRSALKSGADWIVIMNQDLKLTKTAVKQFATKIIKSSPGIVSPFRGSLNIARWTTIMPSKKTDYISGACMAIHKNVITSVGYFYDPFFMYYEDADYSIRAKKLGFPLLYSHTRGIKHDDSPSLGKGSYLHEYYLSRNHLLFLEREAPLSVKVREFVRLPKTLLEYSLAKNYGGLEGIKDYLLRKFDQKL